MPLSLYTLILCLTYLAAYKAETCLDQGSEFERAYVANGQPVYVTCPLYYDLMTESNFTVSWYKNGSKNPFSLDRMSRIHQHEHYLKFIPANVEDSEFYLCVLRNSTYCYQKRIKVEVFNYDDGMCYSSTALYILREYFEQSINVHCPNLDNFDIKNVKLEWFKDCIPLVYSGNKYLALNTILTINNVTKQDEGKYTCEVPYYYNSTRYTISRTGDLILNALPIQSLPAITNPTNNIMDVELGSSVNIICKVLFKKKSVELDFIYWIFEDDHFIENYEGFNERVLVGEMYKTSTNDDENWLLLDLNFTEIKEDDYDKKFFCTTSAGSSSKAFVMFKHPAPNFQGSLIAFFVSLVSVIIMIVITFKIFKVDIVLFYRSYCATKKVLQDGKIYDAYVMYPKNNKENGSYTMDIFALKFLPEVLERQCSYRLFIFGRDDIPGEAKVDVIDQAITQSRRLIIVLGNTSSGYHLENDFEQQIAMYDALIRNKIKVILVELGRIASYTNMPESIKYIKQKQGVVRWKGELIDANLSPTTKFWKNLRYRLPPEQPQSLEDSNYITTEHF